MDDKDENYPSGFIKDQFLFKNNGILKPCKCSKGKSETEMETEEDEDDLTFSQKMLMEIQKDTSKYFKLIHETQNNKCIWQNLNSPCLYWQVLSVYFLTPFRPIFGEI